MMLVALLQMSGMFAPPREPVRMAAVRVASAITIDGRLDEPAWRATSIAGGWRKIDPDQGTPASAATDARIAFDREYVYVAIVAHDSVGAPAPRVRNLQRDFRFDENDAVAVVFDAFDDQRTGQIFQTTAAGNQRDAQFLVGQGIDQDWDVPWRVRTVVTDSGWTAEMAIPWSSLRYPDGQRPWRVNFYRGLRRLDEFSSWSLVPRGISMARTDYAGYVDGLEPPRSRAPLQLQPYMRSQSDWAEAPLPRRNTQTVGGELKWKPSVTTVVDVTVNTDFAQAEVDRQVVNLTRFSPFFPERRQFFLENRALFSAGLPGRVEPFFSRSIGLASNGEPVPILFGGRAIRRTATSSSGMLLVKQGAADRLTSSEIGVARSTVNLGSQSRLGALLVGRHDRGRDAESGWHGTLAVDAFTQMTSSAGLGGSFASTRRSTGGGDGYAGHVSLTQSASYLWSDVTAEFVSAGFSPDAGFLARQDYAQLSSNAFFDLRPRWLPSSVRSAQPYLFGSLVKQASTMGFLEAQVQASPLSLRWQNAASADLGVEWNWQRLDEPFVLVPGVRSASGDYAYTRLTASAAGNPASALAWSTSGSVGRYFSGRLATVSGSLSWSPDPRVALRTSYTANRLTGFSESEDAITHLLAPELRLALNPQLQLATFYQFNTAARRGSVNMRFAWELAPLSFVYVIWNGQRVIDGLSMARRPSESDQLTVKFSYLFRR
ncbi:MAG: carbohydrate binding family 9 domain-containing protein [Gemmatimonas sp.]